MKGIIIEILCWTPLGIFLVPITKRYDKWNLLVSCINGLLQGIYLANSIALFWFQLLI